MKKFKSVLVVFAIALLVAGATYLVLDYWKEDISKSLFPNQVNNGSEFENIWDNERDWMYIQSFIALILAYTVLMPAKLKKGPITIIIKIGTAIATFSIVKVILDLRGATQDLMLTDVSKYLTLAMFVACIAANIYAVDKHKEVKEQETQMPVVEQTNFEKQFVQTTFNPFGNHTNNNFPK